MNGINEYDAIVVGSGAAGGWAAKELTEGGMKVLLLEAGRPIKDEMDYPMPPPEDSRLMVRVKGMLTGQQVQIRSFGYNGKTAKFFTSDRDNPYHAPPKKPFNWFRGRQVGGRMHVWGRYSLRMSDGNFKAASQDGVGVDWPIGYSDLKPFYNKVERFHGLRGNPDGIEGIPDGVYSAGHPLNQYEKTFKKSVESRFQGRKVISARILGHSHIRETSPIAAAKVTGNLTLRANSVVEKVLLDSSGRKAKGVMVIDRETNERIQYAAPVVMLCASAIESVRILLNSGSRYHPDGLGNSSGLLGKHLMDHMMVVLSGAFGDENTVIHRSQEGGDPYDYGLDHGFYIPRFQNLEGQNADFLRGYSVQGAIARGNLQWHMMSQGEILPQETNRVVLHKKKKDRWGIPVSSIEFEFGENERAMIAHARQNMCQMADAAGLPYESVPRGKLIEKMIYAVWKSRLVSPTGASLPGTSSHEAGGARMGTDPRCSVLDASNQLWDARNVFVTDGACFNSVGNQNITLTIMAVTARACRHVLLKFGASKGEASVRDSVLASQPS